MGKESMLKEKFFELFLYRGASMSGRVLKLIAFFSTFSLFCAHDGAAPDRFTITNYSAAIVSVWVAKTHESVTRQDRLQSWWVNEDEYRGLGALYLGERKTFDLPWVARYGKPWQSFFIRHEERAQDVYPVLGDPRYARQRPMGQGGDPEPLRTFKRNRAVTFKLGNYEVTEGPDGWKAEHTTPNFPEFPCRLYMRPTEPDFQPKDNFDHLYAQNILADYDAPMDLDSDSEEEPIR